jgi:hypothetical protein
MVCKRSQLMHGSCRKSSWTSKITQLGKKPLFVDENGQKLLMNATKLIFKTTMVIGYQGFYTIPYSILDSYRNKLLILTLSK